MALRTVSVTLTAQVTGYLANLRAAERATREVDAAAETAAQKLANYQQALQATGRGFLAVGATAAAGLALAVKAASDYGAKMAELQALSRAGQSEMRRMSDAAMEQGRAFGYSATQVADAEIELTKAGRSAADMLGGDLKGALALAAAGQIDVAKATAIGVTAVTQFAKQGTTIPHVADLLAAGSTKALGSVEDLGMALNQGGLVASQMGVSIEETTGTLAAFANAGLLGSDAGTSLKTMLLSLQSPTAAAAAALEEYNVKAYDTEGRFVGIASLAGQLKAGFAGASDAERDMALSTIFGSDAIRSANVLYKEGASGIRGMTKEVDDQGYAVALAAGKLNSLSGDWQKFTASLETESIKAGQTADGMLRRVVQTATAGVNAIGDLPPSVQSAGVTMTSLVAITGLAGGAFLLAVPQIAAFRAGLVAMNLTGRQAAGLFGKGTALLVGIGALTSGFAAMAQRGTASAQQTAQMGKALKEGWGGLDETFARAGNALNAGSGLRASLESLSNGDAANTKMLDGWTFGLTHFADVYKSNEQTLDAMGQQLAALAQQDYGAASQSFAGLVDKYDLGADATRTLLENMPAYRDELAKQAEAAGVSASTQSLVNIAQQKGAGAAKVLAAAQARSKASAEAQAEGLATLSGSAAGAKSNIDDLEKAIEGFGSATLNARGAQAAMEKAIDDARDAIGKNGKGLRLSTEAGRENDAALRDIASSTATAAAKTVRMTGSTDDARKVMQRGRDEFIKAAAAAGVVGDKAQRLADKYGLIPEKVTTAVDVAGYDDAIDRVKALRDELAKVKNKSVTVSVNQDGTVSGAYSDARESAEQGNATGGAIVGGPKGVDTHLRMLAGGEHVWTASEVDAAGGQDAMYAMRAAVRAGVAGLARGGSVTARSLTATLPRASVHLGDSGTKKPGFFGGIYDQTRKATAAAAEVTEELTRYHAETRALRRATGREAAAQKAYEAVGSGKKNAGAKRRAKATLDAAKKTVASLEKTHEATRARYQEAKSDRDEARQSRAAIRLGREDFVSAERRDPNRRSTDPLGYVDQLRQMSRDEDFSPTRRKAMRDAANGTEKALVDLTKRSAAASEKLEGLRQSATQLHDSIRDAVFGGYRASAATPTETTTRNGGWVTRNGMRFQTTEQVQPTPTAAGLASYYAKGAGAAKRFADDLARLAKTNLSPTLLAEVAGYGVEQGQPIVTALLSATAAQRAAINRDYRSIYASAGAAGTTIADDKYATQIASAKADADAIQATMTSEGEKLRKLIARAFGLSGYAAGTTNASAGLHLVGEEGPELVGFRGGEWVANARDTSRWVRGLGGAGSSGGGPVVVQVPAFPDTITVQDASGFRATMRVVAAEVVTERNDAIAVGLMGASV